MPRINQSETDKSLSPAVQDYLRAIYQTIDGSGTDGRATTTQLAERLGVRPASVTAMLQRMAAADPALIEYHKSHGARLTDDGLRAALGVVRCHRLLEQYLHEKLGFGWDEVHAEADRLEHVLTDELTSRIDEVLGYPTHDPHGHAIPAADLSLSETVGHPLSELAVGMPGVVMRVRDEDADMLRYLDSIGLRPGACVAIQRRDSMNGLIWLAVNEDNAPLNERVARHVFIHQLT